MGQYSEMVIGLEVHIELSTKTKIFCHCPTAFGAPPNSQCCPVCAGMPGALPVLNRQVVEYAIMAGLATHCAIGRLSRTARKHYFYPDLPKGYQISQQEQPLCTGGYLQISTPAGEKRVGISRIHIEEDAGKLLHRPEGDCIDLNRCGVPLIEVVSAPDMGSPEEAVAYLKQLRAIVLYLGISDARMNEGSFRCDVNLSVRKPGERALGTRTEIKNLNSFAFVGQAIKSEAERQAALLEAGEALVQETRRFDPKTGQTYSMRKKEGAGDYRFFPEPDLPPFAITKAEIERLRAALPELPQVRRARYMAQYGLEAYHSEMLVQNRAMALLFDAAAPLCSQPRTLAFLLISEGLRLMNREDEQIHLSPQNAAATANLLAEGRINGQGAKKLLAALWQAGGSALALAGELGLEQISDEAALAHIAENALAQNPKMAADYRAGKQAAFKGLMGAAMKAARGRANPQVLERLLKHMLAEGGPARPGPTGSA